MIERFKPYDGQISTGFHSTLPLMDELSEGSVGTMMRHGPPPAPQPQKMPSWGYEVDHGATTIWERWDGWVEVSAATRTPGMNSFAHLRHRCRGRSGCTRRCLGIEPGVAGVRDCCDSSQARAGRELGEGVVPLNPRPDCLRLGAEGGRTATERGHSAPPNVSGAGVSCRRSMWGKVSMEGGPIAKATGVTVEGVSGGCVVVCRVGSGKWEFVVQP